MLSEDPNFTGSRSSYVEPEVLQVRTPFRVAIRVVSNYTNGKVTSTYYDWRVTLLGLEVCQFDVWNKQHPRTRKAALTQARAAIKRYVEFQTTVANKVAL